MMFDQQPHNQQDKRGYTNVKHDEEFDIESGETLYPGLSLGENQLRWGFIRKVYGILSAQILLTTIVSVITVFYAPLNLLLRGNSPLLLFLVFLPFICMIYYLFRHFMNELWFNCIDLILFLFDLI
jgi:FtsH-binding integral membrane protein